jgi:hypothetical protein
MQFNTKQSSEISDMIAWDRRESLWSLEREYKEKSQIVAPNACDMEENRNISFHGQVNLFNYFY